MIKAIIHDWDDIVTNSFEAYSRLYFDFGKHFKLKEPTIEGIKSCWGKTISQIVFGQWPDLGQDRADKMTWEFIDYLNRKGKTPYQVRIFPDVVEAFERLSRKFELAILSSGYKPDIEKIYKEMIHPNLAYHKIIVGPPELKIYKPDPRAFDSIFNYLDKRGISEKETIYVGDSLIDLMAAQNRRLEFYGVTTGITGKDDFRIAGLKDNHIVGSFSDIVSLLEN